MKNLLMEVIQRALEISPDEYIENLRYALGYDDAMRGANQDTNKSSESYEMGYKDGLGDRDG